MWPLIKARGSFKIAKMLQMAKKPNYEELEQRVKELEREALQGKRAEEELKKVVMELHSL